MSTSKLIVISAPSGGGKTTLCQKLLQSFEELTLSVSSTTRAPRGAERDGKEYFFLSKEEFESRIREGRFAEWALVHGNYYGTSKDVIEAAFARGRSVLLDIDVQGAASLRAAYPSECHTVFISPPSIEILEQRLRARGTDSEETILKRVRNAAEEMRRIGEFEHVVINDRLEKACAELQAIVGRALRGGAGA